MSRIRIVAEIKGGPSTNGSDRDVSSTNGHVYDFEDFELHPQAYELFCSGRPAGLQLKPTRLLLYLIEHRQRTVPKEELLEAIWPGGYIGETTFTTAIGEIRRALSDHGDSQRLIRTFRGRGYRFVGDVTRHAIESAPKDEEAAEVGNQALEPSDLRKARRHVRPGFAVAGGLALLLLIPAVVSWYRAT